MHMLLNSLYHCDRKKFTMLACTLCHMCSSCEHLNSGAAGTANRIAYSLTQFIWFSFHSDPQVWTNLISLPFLLHAQVSVYQNIIMLQFTERAEHSQLGVEDAEERSVCFSNEYLTILSNLNTNPT